MKYGFLVATLVVLGTTAKAQEISEELASDAVRNVMLKDQVGRYQVVFGTLAVAKNDPSVAAPPPGFIVTEAGPTTDTPVAILIDTATGRSWRLNPLAESWFSLDFGRGEGAKPLLLPPALDCGPTDPLCIRGQE